MCGKMAISAYIVKTVEKDPFLRLQKRAKEMFNRHQFLFTLFVRNLYELQMVTATCQFMIF